MSSTAIVVVEDVDNSTRGEVNVMENIEAAERFVEGLLESGCDQGRVRVYAAEKLQMQVSQRPVVSLTTAEDGHFSDQFQPAYNS